MPKLLLVSAIVGSSVIGLILLALIVSIIRSLIDGKSAAWVAGDVATAESKAAAEGWLHRILVAIDIATNVIALRGQQDETISTHSYRASVEGKTWGKIVVKWLDWFQPNHGQKAASGDLERAQVRVAVLTKLLGGGNA